jgi:hypothetical protein
MTRDAADKVGAIVFGGAPCRTTTPNKPCLLETP